MRPISAPAVTRRIAKVAPLPRRRSWLRLAMGAVPSLLLLALAGWVALFAVYAPELPDTRALKRESRPAELAVLAADGTLLVERGAEGRRWLPLDEVAPVLVDAVLAIEDHRFYRHFGLDPFGLARAMLANLQAGGVVAGGSTITQQLAKNLYLTPERSLKRKLEELTLAIWLETRLSKDEILELYLNRVYLGAGTYGVEAAAQRYFGKSAARVGLAEAAMIAGLLKAPSAFAPTSALDRARARASIVLGRMVELKIITLEEAIAARAEPARLADEAATDLAGHFNDWVLDGITAQLGRPERDMVVRTTLDPGLQRHAEGALRRLLEARGAELGVREGAVVVLDRSGAVKALVGGRSYRDSRFNRATAARRQPGSAFKPFVYLTALEAGWTATSPIEDAPIAIGTWRPANLDGRFHGTVTLEDALARSLNAAAVRLTQTLGPATVARTAARLGIASPLQAVPSLALGTSEVTPIELAAAYLTLATGGVRRPVYAVRTIEERGGRVHYRHQPSEARVVQPGHAAELVGMLGHAVQTGSGRAARLDARPAAGKTGTSQGHRDAWFAGFSGDYVAVVWLGNDDNRPMNGVTGGSLAAGLWRTVMLGTPFEPLVAARPVERPVRTAQPAERLIERGLGWLADLVEGALAAARQSQR